MCCIPHMSVYMSAYIHIHPYINICMYTYRVETGMPSGGANGCSIPFTTADKLTISDNKGTKLRGEWSAKLDRYDVTNLSNLVVLSQSFGLSMVALADASVLMHSKPTCACMHICMCMYVYTQFGSSVAVFWVEHGCTCGC